ncbi:MAG: ribonuclease J, partial [bacterium]
MNPEPEKTQIKPQSTIAPSPAPISSVTSSPVATATTSPSASATTGAPRSGFGPRGGRGDSRGGRGGRGGFGGGRGDSRGRSTGGGAGGRGGHGPRPKLPDATQQHKQVEDTVPPLAADSIRIIPLGGVEEIGKNMTAIEFGDDIIVIDIGFQFKDENTPGIDYILPNTKYLEERKSKVRAVIITHGHLDHIGGIPYIMPRIGNPPLYTRMLTSVLINKRQEEFPAEKPLDVKIVEKDETITLGKMKVKFFAVTHTIPDAMGVIVQTPYG